MPNGQIIDFTKEKNEGDTLMGKKKKDTSENNSLWNKPLFIALFPTFVSTALAAVVAFAIIPVQIQDMKEDIGDIKEDIVTLNSKVDKMDEKFNEKFDKLNEKLDDTNDRVSSLEGRMDFIEEIIISNKKVIPADSIIADIDISNDGDVSLLVNPTWGSSDVIGVDAVLNVKLTANELKNEKILVPYTLDNGEEVLFYGQFNDNIHWDGDCVINVYKDKKLILLMDSVYNDGELIEYRQAIPDDKPNYWIVSERECNGDLNKGESWRYSLTNDFSQTFTLDTVTSQNVLSMNQFTSVMDGNLVEYYNGNTSDGFYNDTTGKAYLVSYSSDMTVKTLYCGNFKDGVFNDDTGNAWYITRRESTDYMYFKGIFQNGNTINDSTSHFENPITITRINEIIGDRVFKCNLDWYISEKTST